MSAGYRLAGWLLPLVLVAAVGVWLRFALSGLDSIVVVGTR